MPKIRFHESVQQQLVSADEIKPHPDNYNNGDLDEIRDSVLTSGVYRPVYVNKRTKRIVGGHGLYHTLMDLQQDEESPVIPVSWCSLSPKDELRVVAADNEIAKKARPDIGQLVALLDKLDGDLVGTGVSDDDFERMRESLAEIDDSAGLGEPGLGDDQLSIVVECRDEEQQRDLLERFEAEGLICRPLMM